MGVLPFVSLGPEGSCLFQVDNLNQSNQVPGRPITKGLHYQRFGGISWKKFYRIHGSPDVLLVGQTRDASIDAKWIERLVRNTTPPKIIVHYHKPGETLARMGRLKSLERELKSLDYLSNTRHVSSIACGSPIRGGHLFTIFMRRPEIRDLSLFAGHPLGSTKLSPRGFQNCLTPPGLLRCKYFSGKMEAPAPGASANTAGSFRGKPVIDPSGPAPHHPDFWIKDHRDRFRKLLPEEWARARGYPSECDFAPGFTKKLCQAPGSHEWHWMAECLGALLYPQEAPSTRPPEISPGGGDSVVEDLLHPEVDPGPAADWEWHPPDLSEGSEFYQARLETLKRVTKERNGPDKWIKDGIEMLRYHRQNYGPDGPKRLTVLWWEWPKEHWTALREGSSMNFLIDPATGLMENSEMDPEQLKTAIAFMDELIDLAVLIEVDEADLKNNFPLFLVTKAGQPGQWRCIADGKAGGQNDACVSDPLHLVQPQDILPRLYPGGYSAVVDASKYFHMFRTRKGEWKYMGVLHPGTKKWHVYATLPMGTRASPAVACRFGAGFLRTMVEGHPSYQGKPVQNDFAADLQGRPYDPALGTGRVEVDNEGHGANLLFMHVDDTFLHGSTLTKVRAGLDYLMETSVRLGLICQPLKTQPPRQWQKYCGFIYDTRGSPRMYIPTAKYSRAKALVEYLLADQTRKYSRLALATVAGILQSIVPATPGQIGSSYLIHTYRCVHDGMDPNAIGTRAAYYSPVVMTAGCWSELEWWQRSLGPATYHQEQVTDYSLMGIMIGDGSGTGAGGSLSFHHPREDLNLGAETWMGTWISSRAKSQSSNWRELRTLVEFFHREVERKSTRFCHRRVFYFTDNSVTYDTCRTGKSGSPSLHKLITELKSLEMQLRCLLTVVHLPGDQIIAQGSDGLSRGLWMPAGHESPTWSLSSLFEPVSGSKESLPWLLGLAATASTHPEEVHMLPHKARHWQVIRDDSSWRAHSLINRYCIWFVSPSLARQAMTAAIQAWCESPLTSSHFFVIPRVLQRDYGRVNKHVDYLGQFDSPDAPLSHPLPIVVFFLPLCRRRFADLNRGLDSSPNPREPGWVSRQLKHLCGL